MPPRQASRQAQGRQPDVIDVEEYTRNRGPTVIDLTDEPDSPLQRSQYALPPRSSSRNPQPHTQFQNTTGGAPPGAGHRQSFHGVTSANNGIGISRTTNLPPRPIAELLTPMEREYMRREGTLLTAPGLRAGSSRDQAIDLTSEFLPRNSMSDAHRNALANNNNSNNEIPDLIMGDVRRNPNSLPPLEPFQSSLTSHLGRLLTTIHNPVPRIHNFFFDVTRVAWARPPQFHDPFNVEVPMGNPEPPTPAPQQPEAPPNPPELPPTRAGFTRQTCEDQVAVCPSCNEELAYNPGEPPSVASPNRRASRTKRDGEHHFWAVKKCGHVFCSQCFEGRRRKDTGFKHSGNKVACAVDDCSSDVSAKTAWIGIYL